MEFKILLICLLLFLDISVLLVLWFVYVLTSSNRLTRCNTEELFKTKMRGWWLRQKVTRGLSKLLKDLVILLNDACASKSNRLAICSVDTLVARVAIMALGCGNVKVREQAAKILGHIADVRAVASLIAVLRDEPTVSWAAIDALGQIGDLRAIEPLVTLWTADTRYQTGIRCYSALEKISAESMPDSEVKKLIETLAVNIRLLYSQAHMIHHEFEGACPNHAMARPCEEYGSNIDRIRKLVLEIPQSLCGQVCSLSGEARYCFQRAVSLLDLKRLGQLYEPGTLAHPIYVLAGGTAVQCWLQETANDRQHWDIDLFTFTPDFLRLILGHSSIEMSFFIGGFTQDGIICSPNVAPVDVHITRGSYFDAEIIPTSADVRPVTIQGISMLALSPEFIAVCKLSYPNVHRLSDFLDVLALNRSGQLHRSEYMISLLARTALGKIIDAQSILNLKDVDDLQLLVDFIRFQLIKRFLYWDQVNLEELDPFQLFALVDMGDELLDLPVEKKRFVNIVLANTILEGQALQVAKLGLYILMVGLPNRELDVLTDGEFQAVIHRGLAMAQKNPDYWLSCLKSILMIFQHLACVESYINRCFDWVWGPHILTNIVNRILFEDASRLVLYTSIKSIYYDLSTNRITTSDCTDLLRRCLTPRTRR